MIAFQIAVIRISPIEFLPINIFIGVRWYMLKLFIDFYRELPIAGIGLSLP